MFPRKESHQTMEGIAALKDRIKKLERKVVTLKLNLHDLSEELPIGWQTIPDVADQAYQAYLELSEAKAALQAAPGN